MTKAQDERLLAAAAEARKSSYSPYSQFRVGAAVLTQGGTVFHGANIENASFGLTCCAERVALFKARTEAPAEPIIALALVCGEDGQDISANARMPCGACRQVMTELMPSGARILVAGAGAFVVTDLLPSPFRLDGPGR